MKPNNYWAAMSFFTSVRRQLILASLVGTGALLSTIALLGSSGWLISAASLQPPILTLEIAIVAVRTFGLSRSVLRYSERLMSHKAAFAALTEIRTKVFDAMERVAPTGVVTYSRGDILARVVSDVDRLADFPLRVFMPILSGAITILVTSVATWLILPSAGFLFLATLIASALVMAILVIRGHARTENDLAPLQGELTASTLNVFDGITEIVALGQEDRALRQLAELDQKLVSRTLTNVRAQSFGQSFSLIAQGTAVVGSILLGAQALSDGTLDGRMLAVLVLIPLAMFEAVSSIPQALITTLDLKPSVDRISEIISQESTVRDGELTECSSTNSLTLTNVSAHWAESELRPDGMENTTGLNSVDFHAQTGKLIGLVGQSGSGKSTLAATLVRFLEIQSGTYHIDDTEVHVMASDTVREIVGLFDAGQHVFSTTVLENLRIANSGLSEEEALEILHKVQLDDWLHRLSDGLGTQIGDRGAPMSGGERQRLLLARALVGTHKILVLDEPTEFLDETSAQHTLALVVAEAKSRGIVLITHRLSDLVEADSITLMDRGRTQVTGTFEVLLKTNSYFATSVADERAASLALHPAK